MLLASAAAALQLVAITHVTVIDVLTREPTTHPNTTVIVAGDRIAAVGVTGRTPIPQDARVIDGSGKWLIPGLWDMHVHTVVPTGRQLLSLYVANGVTGVRDMGGDWNTVRGWREEIGRGLLVGPRIVAAGPYLEGHDSPIAHLEVHTPEDARRAVDSLAALGVDFVKVHSGISSGAFFAAANEAWRKHLVIAGHLAQAVSVTEASDAGQRSLEHLLGFYNVCSKIELIEFMVLDRLRRSVFGGCALAKQDEVYTHLARNRTWVTPTLAAMYEYAVLPKHDVPGDTLARFISDSLRTYLAQIFGPPPELLRPNADIVGKQLYAKRRQVVLALYNAGVPILAGTDSPMRNVPPGFGLHHELTELVRSGLSPGEALRAATFEPARYFDALDSLGTIAPGKLGDLVLLDANPLDRIENARQQHIVAVITRGRVYDRAALDTLLSDEERVAQNR
jgi:imidazolonepropionase-like amidohydrolase